MRRRDQPEANSEPENARHNQGEGWAKQSGADPFAGSFDELNGDWSEGAGLVTMATPIPELTARRRTLKGTH